MPDQDAAALFAAVYADPSDDEPRIVLSDLLQQRGDPRGEFLALQLARHGTDASPSGRELALVAAGGQAWLGPLGGLLEPRAVVFERGFPSAGRRAPVRVPDHLIRAPEWSTLTQLGMQNAFDDTRLLARLHRVREVSHVEPRALRGLVDAGVVVPWKALRFLGKTWAEIRDGLLDARELFPRVAFLAFEGNARGPVAATASDVLALLGSLPALGAIDGYFALEELVPIVADLRARRLARVVVRSSTWSFAFDRHARRLDVTASFLRRAGVEVAELVVGLSARGLLDTADLRLGPARVVEEGAFALDFGAVPIATLRAAAEVSGVVLTVHGERL